MTNTVQDVEDYEKSHGCTGPRFFAILDRSTAKAEIFAFPSRTPVVSSPPPIAPPSGGPPSGPGPPDGSGGVP
jgi:hypothetical protein